MRLSPSALRAIAALCLVAPAASAQPDAASPPPAGAQGSGPLTVAVTDAPPFAERGPDGEWSGLAVELATDVGQTLGRPIRIVGAPADTPGGDGAANALAAVAGGRADLALVAASPAAEAGADLTGTFYSARLGVARSQGGQLLDVLGRLFSPTFLWIVLGLCVLLLVVGVGMWALERGDDSDDFEEGKAGIWDGFWWAGVTMTTIGYGDTVPTTTGGRVLALSWMLVSMAVTAALTASLVSALGLQDGGSSEVPDGLQGDRVGVLAGSAAARVLAESRVDARAFPTVDAGLAAVEADSLDAFVDSVPRLRAAAGSASKLRVETTGAEVERWTFAVATGSPLRDSVARAVLERMESPDWRAAVRRYVPSD